jgi:hypothetical protein
MGHQPKIGGATQEVSGNLFCFDYCHPIQFLLTMELVALEILSPYLSMHM